MSGYNTLPPGADSSIVKPFKAHIPDSKVQQFKELIKLCPIGPEVYENNDRGNADRFLGMTRKWLSDAKEQWLNTFDWRKEEEYINSFPNFVARVKEDETGETIDVHFVALFSKRKDAVPIAFFHGWPGELNPMTALLSPMQKSFS
jgi:microsomal epoxide hydrolase